ncbi:hypothetical protein [Mesorhizobium tamadayense]|nr:hypothetical protein [Mesorhizobium tamadayense]
MIAAPGNGGRYVPQIKAGSLALASADLPFLFRVDERYNGTRQPVLQS